MKQRDVSVSPYLLVPLVVASLVGAGAVYNRFTKEEAVEPEDVNLVCKAEIRKGRMGEVKSEFFIVENHICEKYLEYKNLPEDTETVHFD